MFMIDLVFFSVSMLAITADSIPIFILADSLIEVTGETTEILDNNTHIPETYYLSQNYPNPFNPTTTISYGIPQLSNVNISIYNILGERVQTLYHGIKSAGSYQVMWNGKNEQGITVTSGVYFYQMQCGNFISTRKMFFIK